MEILKGMLRLASCVTEALDCDVDKARVLRRQMGRGDAHGTATVPTEQSGHMRLGLVELAADLGMAARAGVPTLRTGLFCHPHTVSRRWAVRPVPRLCSAAVGRGREARHRVAPAVGRHPAGVGGPTAGGRLSGHADSGAGVPWSRCRCTRL